MGSDDCVDVAEWQNDIFQSTLPAWGATFFFACSECFFNISIHTPRMGSDHPYLHVDQVQHISIHAPRMGSDMARAGNLDEDTISIHAPRMGSDIKKTDNETVLHNFNPRSPHGERH